MLALCSLGRGKHSMPFLERRFEPKQWKPRPRLCSARVRVRKADGGRRHVVLSSVPLQVLLYLNCYYFAFFFIAEILMFVYKGQVLPYPSSNLALDVLLLFLLLGIEISRIYFAWKGNLTERGVPLTLALGLVVPCVLLSVYLLLWQTYVLRAEVIISSILLVFLGLEAVLSCLAIATFAKAAALQ